MPIGATFEEVFDFETGEELDRHEELDRNEELDRHLDSLYEERTEVGYDFGD